MQKTSLILAVIILVILAGGGYVVYQQMQNSAVVSTATTSTVATTTQVEPPYIADKNNVYCDGKVFSADPKTFKVIVALWDKISGDYGFRVSKDVNHVFFNCDIIPQADPATFSLILSAQGYQTAYAKDKDSVFFLGRFEGVSTVTQDVASFVVLSGDENGTQRMDAYAKDSSRVYLNGKVVTGAIPATFTVPAQQ